MRIGYVLSGGGARGFAHLGVLKFLEELSIYPSIISGTSAGALVGSLYAAGYKADKIMEILLQYDYISWRNLSLKHKGMFHLDHLRDILKNAFTSDDFNSLKVPLHIFATDLNSGKEIEFSSGNLIDPVIASCSIPIVFDQLKVGERVLVDGGILNNFPVEPLAGTCDLIIGSYVNNLGLQKIDYSTAEIHSILDRCFHLAIMSSVKPNKEKCDILIEPILNDFGILDLKKGKEIIEIGYQAACKDREKIISLITEKSNQRTNL